MRRDNMKMRWGVPRAVCAGGALVVMLAGGCSRAIERREALGGYGAGEPVQGASWELVMPTPESAAWLAAAEPGGAPEAARADERLNARPEGVLLATTEWPAPERVSLENPRYILVRDRAGRLTFFTEDRWRARGWRWESEWGR